MSATRKIKIKDVTEVIFGFSNVGKTTFLAGLSKILEDHDLVRQKLGLDLNLDGVYSEGKKLEKKEIDEFFKKYNVTIKYELLIFSKLYNNRIEFRYNVYSTAGGDWGVMERHREMPVMNSYRWILVIDISTIGNNKNIQEDLNVLEPQFKFIKNFFKRINEIKPDYFKINKPRIYLCLNKLDMFLKNNNLKYKDLNQYNDYFKNKFASELKNRINSILHEILGEEKTKINFHDKTFLLSAINYKRYLDQYFEILSYLTGLTHHK
ncbi:MAG: hypothetical protein ACTSRZ_09375 [Promethearchaeota archaeon]